MADPDLTKLTPVDEELIPLPLRQEMMAAAAAKQISYEWLCSLFLQGIHAKLVGPDAGVAGETETETTQMSITQNLDKGLVVINFNKTLKSIFFSKDQAIQMGNHLLECAKGLKYKKH